MWALLVRMPARVQDSLLLISHPLSHPTHSISYLVHEPPSPAHLRPCLSMQSLGHPLAAKHAVLTAPSDAEGCYKDANINSQMCGPTAQATCTGSHDLGKCCSAAGYCGSTDGHCGDGMLVEYSHSKGLCESDLLSQHEEEEEENFDANTTRCVYLQQVASSWVIGVTPHMVGKHMFGDKTDMQTLCAPAVIVAASLTYDLDEECPHTFALKKETPRTDGQVGFNRGLWAVSARIAHIGVAWYLVPTIANCFDAVPVPALRPAAGQG